MKAETKTMSVQKTTFQGTLTEPRSTGGRSRVFSVKPHSEVVNNRAKLLMHRVISRRILNEPEIVENVRKTLDLLSEGEPDHVEEWRVLLSKDLRTLRRSLSSRSEEMTRLRLSSPFLKVVDFKDPSLRRRLYKKARKVPGYDLSLET